MPTAPVRAAWTRVYAWGTHFGESPELPHARLSEVYLSTKGEWKMETRTEKRQQKIYDSPAIQNIYNVRCAEFLDPAYARGFAAGKAKRLSEAFEVSTERVAAIPDVAPRAANPPNPEKLAIRAGEIQAHAVSQGLVMSNIESVRQAYAEAGIPV
jgi:hypothetical protein